MQPTMPAPSSLLRRYGLMQVGWLVLTGWLPTKFKSQGLEGVVKMHTGAVSVAA